MMLRSVASSKARRIYCVAYGWVKTPAAGFGCSLADFGCGALSVPLWKLVSLSIIKAVEGYATYRKNFESPLHIALIRASRSAGVLAMGLQKASGSTVSSAVR